MKAVTFFKEIVNCSRIYNNSPYTLLDGAGSKCWNHFTRASSLFFYLCYFGNTDNESY